MVWRPPCGAVVSKKHNRPAPRRRVWTRCHEQRERKSPAIRPLCQTAGHTKNLLTAIANRPDVSLNDISTGANARHSARLPPFQPDFKASRPTVWHWQTALLVPFGDSLANNLHAAIQRVRNLSDGSILVPELHDLRLKLIRLAAVLETLLAGSAVGANEPVLLIPEVEST